ncbi:beta-amyrin 6-beta-monooxygenase-like [Coffea arabica]|uniref:Beta-amyrin 6-beta-monooxygenase-like n=1 Tax=Coffea arabica TaxID=13443 RepID=A0A6P6US52_COFAR|nr:beta-amyrin 28-monooxygenase-like [Coffea arabica]
MELKTTTRCTGIAYSWRKFEVSRIRPEKFIQERSASLIKPLQFLSPGENSLKEFTAKNRSSIEEILKPQALKHYIPITDSMARDQLETNWAPFKEVKVYPLSKKYTFSLACRLFLGVEDHKVVKTLSNSFNVALSGMYSIPIDLPGTAYNKALKGGNLVKDEILKILKKRKTELLDNRNIAAEGLDMLSRLLLQSDENGSFSKE